MALDDENVFKTVKGGLSSFVFEVICTSNTKSTTHRKGISADSMDKMVKLHGILPSLAKKKEPS